MNWENVFFWESSVQLDCVENYFVQISVLLPGYFCQKSKLIHYRVDIDLVMLHFFLMEVF